MQVWDPGSFVLDGDDDDLPVGWGEGSPPETPVPQPQSRSSTPQAPSSGQDGDGVQHSDASCPSDSARRSGNNAQIVLPWGPGVVKSTVRRELPSLFTNVPDQAAGGGLDPKGRPPRPPAPETRMPWSISDAAVDQKSKRERRSSSERPALVAARVLEAAEAAASSETEEVRHALQLLRKQKKWVSADETLEHLAALQHLQRQLRGPSELPPLASGPGGGGGRLERLRAASVQQQHGGHRPRTPRGRPSCGCNAVNRAASRSHSRASSKSSVGPLPELPATRRASSAPLSARHS